MGKIRHIAYRCSDIETYEKFFVEGLGMQVVQRRPGGAVDLTDGTINITRRAWASRTSASRSRTRRGPWSASRPWAPPRPTQSA
jgi:catechol 2,3-dioxygenase-like lactoylglutathione lyase family enzyme